MNSIGVFFQKTIRRIKAVPKFLKDKRVALWKKLLIALGLVYLVLPFDFIPPIIPVFGWLDDIILWLYLLYYLRDQLDSYDVPHSEALDVNYTVNSGEGEENE
jgi:uncharacterized membrane protein YkvA (DUF1232 family)